MASAPDDDRETKKRVKKNKKKNKKNKKTTSSSTPVSSTLSSSHGRQTRQEWYQRGAHYWKNADATVDGVLGGFGHVSTVDIADSRRFLKSLDGVGRDRAVDLGAGIGRVVKGLLLPLFKSVDLVDQDKKYVDTAREELCNHANMGQFVCSGLQDLELLGGGDSGDVRYDVIWFQWVLGHFPDSDLESLLRRCRECLQESGVIVVKENMSSGGFVLDKEDMSVTRSESAYKAVFESAGLKVVEEMWQTKFPKELYPVKMFALR